MNVKVDDEAASTTSSMVTKESVFAIRADNPTTNYFLLHCVSEEAEHLDPEPIIDTVGNVIHFGMKYITGRYLEISNFTNKYHEFEVRRKHIFVQGTTVFFPQVPLMYVSKTGATVKIANDIILELQVRSSLSM